MIKMLKAFVHGLLLVTLAVGCNSAVSNTSSPLPTATPNLRQVTIVTATPGTPAPREGDVSILPQIPPELLSGARFAGLPEIGGRIAFATDAGGTYQIAVMDLTNGSVRVLTNSPPPGDAEPFWSPDGKKLIFNTGRNKGTNFELFEMEADGTRPRVVIGSSGYGNYSPAYSPDGRKVLFHTNRDGNMEVYVADADGRNQINLTNHPANDVTASWSPDGSKVVFSSDRNGMFQIFVMNADGSDVRLLFDHPDHSDLRPRYSPDGRRIVFGTQQRYETDYHLALIDADGGNYELLTSGVGQFSQAAWIDNNSLVLSARRGEDDRWQLYILKREPNGGISLTPVTFAFANHRNPVWTK
ncbi:MAG: PD40 domain-containing protein [Chloroflexi bacterium]|jgi:Tol biopolymer transport system component|nr:PD40 domain-containing protein [Chloroflexota bacterium]